MILIRGIAVIGLVLCTAFRSGSQAGPDTVPESARKIPVAGEFDVVVVGGGAGAVAAAEAAAKKGARVFLAAPRTYLGEDVAGTLRFWSDPDQELTTPLAKKLFATDTSSARVAAFKNSLRFTYTADLPTARIHPDTKRPSRLRDGKWRSASKESVQYDGDVTLVADLGRPTLIDRAIALVFHAKDFLFESVTIHVSADKSEWKEIAVVKNDAAKRSHLEPPVTVEAKVGIKVRYVRFLVKRTPGSTRILVGEIVLTGPSTALEETVPKGIRFARPLHIKRTLDETLIAAGVPYLHGCYACDVLRDAYDKPCGIVMANRGGRQAVIAKVIVDATDRAWVARKAGAKAKPYPPGPRTFRRVVIGGELRSGEGVTGRALPSAYPGQLGDHPIFEYTLKIQMPGGSFVAWAAAEQAARDRTYHPEQVASSDMLFQVPPDPIVAVKRGAGDWPGAAGLDLDSFRPEGVERVFVLGGCADLPRSQAEKLLEPPVLIETGTRIGAAAAEMAKELPRPRDPGLAGGPVKGPGDVKEVLDGVRPGQKVPTINQAARSLPLLGRYDVVVVGGGTSGAPAGIAAARRGAETLVIEYQYGLGGVGTLGLISGYYWGNRVGFTKEVFGGVTRWNAEQKAEWWRENLRKAGAEIWYGSMGCGAYVVDGCVKGVVVATPRGRGVVLAKTVIDATGNADVAAAAGATCITTGGGDLAVQGTGLPPRTLGKQYTNTDYTLVDETDLMDVWRIMVAGRQMAGSAFDQGPLIDTRERRRIDGDFTVTIFDGILKRTQPDTILQAYSNFDTHGYTVDAYFTLNYPHKKGIGTDVPFRAMLPKGLEGLLVVGLGMSVHRDAIPVIRMQPDLQNGGYAAGVAAAMATQGGKPLRGIDLKALQRHLVKIGNLKEHVLADKDSFPLPKERIAAAVQNSKDPYVDIAVILSHPRQALPLAKQAYAGAKDAESKLRWAQILSALGDGSGLEPIIAAVEAAPKLDEGWRYKGMGQFGSCMSPLDSLIFALGRIGDRKATPAIVAKLKLLEAGTEFSHFRAIAWALDRIGDPAAAATLAEVLQKEGIRGQAVKDAGGVLAQAKGMGWTATAPRANALRELFLAKALFRCCDKDGLGRKVLEEYTNDLRGHLARHARAVLESSMNRRSSVIER